MKIVNAIFNILAVTNIYEGKLAFNSFMLKNSTKRRHNENESERRKATNKWQ